MAKLYFKYGTMNSGKSLEIIKVAHNYREQDKDVIVFTPGIDDRYSKGTVYTISDTKTNTGSSNWSKGTYGTKVTKTITRTFTSKYTLSYNGNLNYILAYGGGAYILKNATLKNCLIRWSHYLQS